MKKQYITPKTYCVNVESTAIMAGSGNKSQFTLGVYYPEEGEVTEDDDNVSMCSKKYNAWNSWDE